MNDSEDTDDEYDIGKARCRGRRQRGQMLGQYEGRYPRSQRLQRQKRSIDGNELDDMSSNDRDTTRQARPGRATRYTNRRRQNQDVYDADEDRENQDIGGPRFDRSRKRAGRRAFGVGSGYGRGNSYDREEPLVGARRASGELGHGSPLTGRHVYGRNKYAHGSHRRPRRRVLAAAFDDDDDEDRKFPFQRSRRRRRRRRRDSGWTGKAVLLMIVCGGSIAIAGTAIILMLLIDAGRTLYAEDLMDWISDCADLMSADR